MQLVAFFNRIDVPDDVVYWISHYRPSRVLQYKTLHAQKYIDVHEDINMLGKYNEGRNYCFPEHRNDLTHLLMSHRMVSYWKSMGMRGRLCIDKTRYTGTDNGSVVLFSYTEGNGTTHRRVITSHRLKWQRRDGFPHVCNLKGPCTIKHHI